MRPRRPLLALVLAALGAVVALSACSDITGPPAASVNGVEISMDALEDEIRAIRGNPQYRQQVEAQLGQVAGAGEGTFDASFTSRVLSLRVYVEIIEQELADRGVEVTESDIDAVRERVIQQSGGEAVFSAFPEEYQRLLQRRDALVEAAFEAVTAELSPERAREHFEENREEFTEVCVRHIFVSFDEWGVQGAADRARSLARQITSPADFDRLVARSDDPGAGDDGFVGCGPAERFGQLASVVADLPVGQVSEPVESGSGWHIVLVTERTTPEFEDVEPIVRQRLQQLADTTFQQFLDEATCEADVDVNPRLGDWVPNCSTEGAPGLVQPPTGPTTSTSVPAGVGVPGGQP